MVACVATQHNFLCLHSEQQRRIDFRFAALSKASGHNYSSCLRKWYRIGTWVQVLADTDARIFCVIGGISDTSIRIGTTLIYTVKQTDRQTDRIERPYWPSH